MENPVLPLFGAFSYIIYQTYASIAGLSCADINFCLNVNPLIPELSPWTCKQATIFPCDYEAQVFHGGKSGYCDDNYNCVIKYSGPVGPGNGGITGLILNNCGPNTLTPCQCQTNTLSSLVTAAYEKFCDFDCRCEHGGVGGTCDFINSQCLCRYGQEPWTDELCPEYTPVGFNLSGFSTNVANFVNSFCKYTFPIINYQPIYCTDTSKPTRRVEFLAGILKWAKKTGYLSFQHVHKFLNHQGWHQNDV